MANVFLEARGGLTAAACSWLLLLLLLLLPLLAHDQLQPLDCLPRAAGLGWSRELSTPGRRPRSKKARAASSMAGGASPTSVQRRWMTSDEIDHLAPRPGAPTDSGLPGAGEGSID